MLNWDEKINLWKNCFSLKTFPPASDLMIQDAKTKVKDFPKILEGLFKVSNGLNMNGIKVLPIENYSNLKQTWDSIQRANDPKVRWPHLSRPKIEKNKVEIYLNQLCSPF